MSFSTESSSPTPPPRLSCPRCGNVTAHPFAGAGGVCLRCAGERAFALGTGSPFESLDPTTATASADPADPDAAAHRDTSALDAPARIGPYEIIEELGRGGMGRVFAARQSGLGRIVALKVLSLGPGAPPELEMRFLREAQTVARLRHPHIIAIYDFGRAAGHVYFSMDYLEGGDLSRRLRERTFAPHEAAALVAKIAGALAHAHAEGVLHRDLKPSNILLDGDEPRLADFGLAAQLETSGDFTSASGVFGTPHYLAPEAMRGGGAALSAVSDLYALGVVLYLMLTGRTPFAGASPAELPALVHDTDPPAPRLLAPAVPRDLETICLKCLERDPARRYSSAAALAEDLQRFLAGDAILAQPISRAGHFVRWCRRRPALAAVWFLVLALAFGSSFAALWIARARSVAEKSLAFAQTAEASARRHLRAARLSEARAIRRTTVPGRRTQALAALADAAKISPGLDLRNEALAALLLTDIRASGTWDLAPNAPASITFDRAGRTAAVEMINIAGMTRSAAVLRAWDTATAAPPLEVPGTRVIGPLRFSADGQLVMARYADATLRVWRVADAHLLLTLSDRPLPGGAMLTKGFNDDYDFSPDAALLVLGRSPQGLSLHRVADGAEVAHTDEGALFNVIRFSSDGTLLAAARTQDHATREIFILRTDTLAIAHQLTQTAAPSTFDWTGTGDQLIVATEDNALASFDARRGRLLARLPLGAHDPVQVLPLDGNRLVATRGVETNLHLVNLLSGQREFSLSSIGPSLIAGVPGGRSFVTTSLDGIATRWTVQTPVGLQTIPAPDPSAYAGTGPAGMLDISADGRWIVSGHGRYTLLREIATGRFAAEWDSGTGHALETTTVAFEPASTSILVCSTLTGLRRHPLMFAPDGIVTFGPAQTLDPEPGFVMSTASTDRRTCVLIDFETGDVKIVEPSADAAPTRSRWKTPGIYNAALNPDASQVLLNCAGQGPHGAEQRLSVHRTADGSLVAQPAGRVSCDTAWSADGRTALTSNGPAESTLWNTATWTPRAKLTGELGGDATTFALSPDGSYAVIVRDDHIHLVSTADGVPFATILAPDSANLASAVKFLPDARRFAILWPDSRVDIVDPAAMRAALEPMGLAW